MQKSTCMCLFTVVCQLWLNTCVNSECMHVIDWGVWYTMFTWQILQTIPLNSGECLFGRVGTSRWAFPCNGERVSWTQYTKMQKHYRNTGHTGQERLRELAQGCDGHQQNDCHEDCQYPPTTIPWVETKQHQIQNLLTLVQSLVTLHYGDSKHRHTCYIQWINVQAMSRESV